MPDLEHVKVDGDGELAVVTIARPEKLNALNAAVLHELEGVFAGLAGDNDVRGIVLTGAGEKAFVAGADIRELGGMTPSSAVETSRVGQRVFTSIERCGKPVVAAIGGYALGGGLELALACHLRIASENARFGLPEVGLGLIPGYGGTVRLARVIGLGRAIEMTLTADPVDARTAEAFGLVSRVVPSSDLLTEAKAFARRITRNAPGAVEKALESIHHALDSAMSAAQYHESALFGVLSGTEDMREGLAAFLERRAPDFKGR